MKKIPKAWTEWQTPKVARGNALNGERMTIKRATTPRRDENVVYKSADMGSVAPRQDKKVYTGTLVTGIATMHKSNAVPVINKEQATEISQMRRS